MHPLITNQITPKNISSDSTNPRAVDWSENPKQDSETTKSENQTRSISHPPNKEARFLNCRRIFKIWNGAALENKQRREGTAFLLSFLTSQTAELSRAQCGGNNRASIQKMQEIDKSGWAKGGNERRVLHCCCCYAACFVPCRLGQWGQRAWENTVLIWYYAGIKYFNKGTIYKLTIFCLIL